MLKLGSQVDLAEEALRSQAGGQLGMQHLESDLPVVTKVLRQIDRSHPAPTELALDRVARLQGVADQGHD